MLLDLFLAFLLVNPLLHLGSSASQGRALLRKGQLVHHIVLEVLVVILRRELVSLVKLLF
jgi:hypothetical protein